MNRMPDAEPISTLDELDSLTEGEDTDIKPVGEQLTQDAAATQAEALGLDLTIVPRAYYEFGAEVARGGLGKISRARDLRLDRYVAIKELLKPVVAAEARFLREIEVTVRLEHPNIVSIHEAGRWPTGQLFYAMNFVAGETLLEAIANCVDLEERLILLPTVLNIAEAIAFAHSEGVIHRDLKPANVLVGRFGETVVIDWGLAKYPGVREPETTDEIAPRAGVTGIGHVVGTPPYMPPEQAAGSPVDKTCDVYALGAVLYHVLSGRPPYFEPSSEPILTRIQQSAATPLSQVDANLPKDLIAIVEKAMARDPKDRYPSGESMTEELQRFTTGRLVGAYEYRAVDLVRRFLQRNAGAVATAVIAGLALLVGAAYSVAKIRNERDTATHNAVVAAQERDTAEARAEALIVTQAKALTATDPTRAVAWLKRLKSPPAGAVSVAARAEEYGVARWVYRGHDDAIRCLAISPDGKKIVSGSDDKTLRIWQLGRLTSALLSAHTDRVTDCAYSTSGSLLASSSYDGLVVLWNTETLGATRLAADGGAIKGIQFSPDQKTLATASDNGHLRFWDLSTSHDKQPASRDYAVQNSRQPLLSYARSPDPDGQYPLLSGVHAGTLRLWDGRGKFQSSRALTLPSEAQGSLHPPRTHAERPAALSTNTQPTSAVLGQNAAEVFLGTDAGGLWRWSPPGDRYELIASFPEAITRMRYGEQGRFLITTTMDGSVYHISSQTHAVRILMRHMERVSALAISPTERFVATGSWDQRVRVVDLRTGNVRSWLGHSDVVSQLAFTSDERFVVSGAWDKTIRVWPLRDELHDNREIVGHHRVGVHSVRFSPDGKWLASGGHDNTVRLWSLAGGEDRAFAGHTDHIYRVLFSHDGQWLASSSDDQSVRLWATRGDSQFVLAGHEADVEELAFSPDDRFLVSASEDHTARLWNLKTQTSIVLYHDHDVTSIDFNANGDRFATASRDGKVRLFETHSGKELRVFSEHKSELLDVAFAPNGKQLAAADQGGSVWLHSLEPGSSIELANLSFANQATFSPDGRWLAVSGATPHLWLCSLERAQCDELEGHTSIVRALRFTPDSRTLITGGGDSLVYLWDVLSQEYRVFQGHQAAIFDVDISPDGRLVATASGDETVRTWPRIAVPKKELLLTRLKAMTSETVSTSSEQELVSGEN